MDKTQTKSTLKFRNRKQLLTKKQQQVIYDKNMIQSTFANVKSNFSKLQQAYVDIADKNQSYLLSMYLKVLDKMLDQVIYEQQKLNIIDCEAVKDQKCVNYSIQIVKYRDQCYNIKSILQNKTQQLKQQQKATENLQNQIKDLKILCNKKDYQIQKLSSSIKLNLNAFSKQQIISTIPQKTQKQQQNPQYDIAKHEKKVKTALKMRRRLSLQQQRFAYNSKLNCTKRLQVSPHAKSYRENEEKNLDKYKNSSTADSARLRDYEELFPSTMENFDKLAFNNTIIHPNFHARLGKTHMTKNNNHKEKQLLYKELFKNKKFKNVWISQQTQKQTKQI